MRDPRTPVEHRLELRATAKRFGDFTAVAPLDLAVRDREFVVLLGPEGCGKTTTLRLIAGLERATAGTILIDGFEVTPMPPQRRDVAMAFQTPALYPHLTVERNIAYPMRAQRIPPNVITRRVNEVIERLRLDGLRRRKPRRLCAAEQQLVSLGRAMVRDPKAFLYDEPLPAFEGEQREHMRRELREVHHELRATTVLATRDPQDALVLADRIAVINEGRLLQYDVPQVVADRPADLFVARLVASPAMNFIEATCENGVVRLACCDMTIAVDDRGARPVDPARITLGIRPDHVRIDPRGVPAVAGRTEARGADHVIDLRLGKVSVTTAIPAQRQFADGERVMIRFDPGGCRWFDAISGKALPWQPRERGQAG